MKVKSTVRAGQVLGHIDLPHIDVPRVDVPWLQSVAHDASAAIGLIGAGNPGPFKHPD
jgi:hypothetical protein